MCNTFSAGINFRRQKSTPPNNHQFVKLIFFSKKIARVSRTQMMEALIRRNVC